MSNNKKKKQFLTYEDINKLKYVKVQNPFTRLDNFPDFLIIGPQRTGTTWLHYNLNKNPFISMSEPKETHYFRDVGKKDIKHRFNKNFNPDLSSYLNYFNKKNNIFSFARNKTIRLSGESSATYALLEKDIISDILILNPEIKIIMLIRNPIERVWSHLKLHFINNPGINYIKENQYVSIEDIPEELIINFINRKDIIENSFFTKIIEKWSSMVGKERFFYGNFNDISNSPEDLLHKIHSFLEIDFDKSLFSRTMKKKYNKSVNNKISNKINNILEERYFDEVKYLKNKYSIEI